MQQVASFVRTGYRCWIFSNYSQEIPVSHQRPSSRYSPGNQPTVLAFSWQHSCMRRCVRPGKTALLPIKLLLILIQKLNPKINPPGKRNRYQLALGMILTAAAMLGFHVGVITMILAVGCWKVIKDVFSHTCLLYTSPSPRDRTRSRMPSSA